MISKKVKYGLTNKIILFKKVLIFSIIGISTIFLTLFMLEAESADASSHIQPHLSIISADIVELEYNPDDVKNRPVEFYLIVQGSPQCSPKTGILNYGFLIDSDKNNQTGISYQALNDLGVDAHISLSCDPSTGLFTSPLGQVTIEDTTNGETKISILTEVGLLPSIDFNWIAYAQEDSLFIRVPENGTHGYWSIIENLMW